MKKSVNPVNDIASIVTANISANRVFKEIENKYMELNIPHYSKT